jgi:4-diphosphocytidyl-2-C-methyl-D-erythritol kinase
MTSLPSFAKVNLGLKIGARRPDGFHELRTVYQTLALHDRIGVEVRAGSGIEVRCADPRVPRDRTNTCYKTADRVMKAAGTTSKIVIEIEKQLPVQGGLGAASSNAVVTMLALERALDIELSQSDKLRIAAEVGSDLPLFLVGGTVLGLGRGERVYALSDLPVLHLVVVTPPVGISTPRAFARWDELGVASQEPAEERQLTGLRFPRTIDQSSESVLDWLAEYVQQAEIGPASGVPADSGDRAETLLLDLVRTGIENDFERVVFPEYPELREVKELLQREGAQWASLSGSGSTLYGIFASADEASAVAERMRTAGHAAVATTSLTRDEYWKAIATAPP